MPKVVDHEQRRREIVDALWRVIQRDGLAAASVRTVAAESGWSAGSLRHYFATQDELRMLAMTSLLERATERIEGTGRQVRDLDSLARWVCEALPVDPLRRAESEVWLAMAAAAATDPGMRDVLDDAFTGMRRMCDSAVRFADQLRGGGLALDAETERLHALVDGLAVHGTRHPDRMPPARLRAAVRDHLGELVSRPR